MLLSKRSGFDCNVAYLYCSHLAPESIVGEFSYIAAVFGDFDDVVLVAIFPKDVLLDFFMGTV